jgi:ketosteroid isomerase-like protein
MMQRDDVLHDIVDGTDTVTAARNEGMEVHEFGGTTAAVTGWLIVEGRGKGGPFTHRYRFTDTWVKRKGGWQIVAAQDYLAPK